MKIKLIILFFLIANAMALEFHPSHLKIDGKINEEICKKIYFSLDNDARVSILWSDEKTRDLKKFKEHLENKIKTRFKEKLNKSEKNLEICFEGKVSGKYYGVVLIKQKAIGNSMVQFLIWIECNFEKEKIYENPYLISLSVLQVFLISVLVFVLKNKRKCYS